MFGFALILAGGQGTRLKPLTDNIPKPLLPIGDKPIIEKIITDFRDTGIRSILIAVNYKKEMIKNYFKEGRSLNVDIDYLEEDIYIGTAGAMALIPEDHNVDFVLCNGDIVADIDYKSLYKTMKDNNFDLVIVAVNKKSSIDFGVLSYDGNYKLENWTEKPTYEYSISAGIYGISKEVLEYIRNNIEKNSFINMPEMCNMLKENNFRIGVYVHSGNWEDIGRIEDYIRVKG